MSEPFLADVKIFAFNFAPRGWAQCNGQILPINQNQSLFSLLGTTFGGDGRTTFALPDLRGRVPVHVGSSSGLGIKAGTEVEQLTEGEMPSHGHTVPATSGAASVPTPATNLLADTAPNEVYHGPTGMAAMKEGTIATAGSGSGHNNMQPYLTLNFCIALTGVFPSRN